MPTALREKAQTMDFIFDNLHDVLARHVPPFKPRTGTIRNKRDFHLVVPKPVAIPGAYGGKPTDVEMAAIIHQKGYVGFYYMPVYLEEGFEKRLPPAVMKLRKGKCCFYVKKVDADLLRDIDVALREGTKLFKKRGWI
jgi:hypothetical protein